MDLNLAPCHQQVKARRYTHGTCVCDIEEPIPIGCCVATVSVGQIFDNAFRRPIPVIQHRCRLLDVAKHRMRPGCVIKTPPINTQLLMSQRQSHLRASPSSSPSSSRSSSFPILVSILVSIVVPILVPILVDLRTSMAGPYTGHHAKHTRNSAVSHIQKTPVNIDSCEIPVSGGGGLLRPLLMCHAFLEGRPRPFRNRVDAVETSASLFPDNGNEFICGNTCRDRWHVQGGCLGSLWWRASASWQCPTKSSFLLPVLYSMGVFLSTRKLAPRMSPPHVFTALTTC